MTVTWDYGDGTTEDAPVEQLVTHTYTAGPSGLKQVTATIDGGEPLVLIVPVPWEPSPYTPVYVAVANFDGVDTFTRDQCPTDGDTGFLIVANAAIPATFAMAWYTANTIATVDVLPHAQWFDVRMGQPDAEPGMTPRSDLGGFPIGQALKGPLTLGAHTLDVNLYINNPPPPGEDWGSGTANFTVVATTELSAPTTEAFDPGEHTVAECIDYLDLHPEELDTVEQAEMAGKNRVTLLTEIDARRGE